MRRTRNSYQAAFALLAAAGVFLNLAGCDKVPTWQEITSGEQPAPKIEPAPQAKPQPAAPAPPPAPTLSADDAINELKSERMNGVSPDRFMTLFDALKERAGEVEELNLRNVRLGILHLKRVAELKNVRAIDYAGSGVDNQSIMAIANLESLEFVDLESTGLGDEGMAAFDALKNVRELNLSRTRVNDAGLAHIANMPNLEVLKLNETSVNGSGLYELRKKRKLPALKHIEARKTMFGQYGFAAIEGSDTLEVLMAGEALVADSSMAGLKGCKNLRDLDVSFNVLTNASLSYISGSTLLERLMLRNTKNIDNQGLAFLKKCKQLKAIDLGGTRCNQDGADALKKFAPNLVAGF